ncbi:hypothetical protein FVR03_01090 [Pontibacter qinzhouensis]|uniref:Uncharacterized protein n=1 Tax=Pontibacter qinzhouensis TaxID=2603253 RepID=A0A5C8KD37_9BACT|nr:hypothetical protein [Pontibacter qinzhouensis]TXK52338.1 hypothetical protein FVR03_01090 [Pontibacter qinzhouensis]
MYKPDKETLEKLRKTAGHGYAPAVIDILRDEHKYDVQDEKEVKREVYAVAHGRSDNEVVMQAFLTLVIRKAKAASPVKALLDEAMKMITSNAA